jgi:hypothetical protein
MNNAEYIGTDTRAATISAVVRDSSGSDAKGHTRNESQIIREFVPGLRGGLRLDFEEATWAACFDGLLKPHVSKVLVCDSRKKSRLKIGNENDHESARKLSEQPFLNKLHPVQDGETGIRTLKELARSYPPITRHLTRGEDRRIRSQRRSSGNPIYQAYPRLLIGLI